jgi:hypothetical protein
MNGLTSHEWIRATIIADVFHWGVVGVLALIGLLVNRWLQNRQHRKARLIEQFPGQFGPLAVPSPFDEVPTLIPEPNCKCTTCGRVHWPEPVRRKEPQ